jgi:hypothetical protein
MQLHTGTLRYSRQTFQTIDLNIGLAVAGDGDLLKQV